MHVYEKGESYFEKQNPAEIGSFSSIPTPKVGS